MISQHRMVNEILKEELKLIHALQLKTKASEKNKIIKFILYKKFYN